MILITVLSVLLSISSQFTYHPLRTDNIIIG